jgi:hypothetical protein
MSPVATSTNDTSSSGPTDLSRRAEHHAKEAECLLSKRWGWINDTLNAQVHATLAVYYAGEARRSLGERREDA